MKFGKSWQQSVIPKWIEFYIDYNGLKRLLSPFRGRQLAPGQATESTTAFLEELTAQIAKVNAFVLRMQAHLVEKKALVDGLRSEILALQSAAPVAVVPGSTDVQPRTISKARSELVAQEAELWHLSRQVTEFVELNYRSIYKITKKLDKTLGTKHCESILQAVERQPWMAVLQRQGYVQAPSGAGSNAGVASSPFLSSDSETTHKVDGSLADDLESGQLPPGTARHAPAAVPTASPAHTTVVLHALPRSRAVSLGNEDSELLDVPLRAAMSQPDLTATEMALSPPSRSMGSSHRQRSETAGTVGAAVASFPSNKGVHSYPSYSVLESKLKAYRQADAVDTQSDVGMPLSPEERVKSPRSAQANQSGQQLVRMPSSLGHHDGEGELTWDGMNSQVADAMLLHFETTADAARTLVRHGINTLEPELISDPEESANIFKAVDVAISSFRDSLTGPKGHGLTVRETFHVVLAAKLVFFRGLMDTVVQRLELVTPEGAAAVSSLMESFLILFRLYQGTANKMKRVATFMGSPSDVTVVKHTASLGAMRATGDESPDESIHRAMTSTALAELLREAKAAESEAISLADSAFDAAQLANVQAVAERLSSAIARSTSKRSIDDNGDPQRSEKEVADASLPSATTSAGAKVDQSWLDPVQHKRDARKTINHWIASKILHRSQSASTRSLTATPASQAVSGAGTMVASPQQGSTPASEASKPPQSTSSTGVVAASPEHVHVAMGRGEWCCGPGLKDPVSPVWSTARSMDSGSRASTGATASSPLKHILLNMWALVALIFKGLDSLLFPADSSAPAGSKQQLSMWARLHPTILDWLPRYNWRKNLLSDIISGVTIGIFALPQGLAYATLAGLPPLYGIYTGLPAALYAISGTSRQAAIGPMSIPALLIGSGLASMNKPFTVEEYVDAAMAISFVSGCFLFLLGFLNMGFLVRFISRPVLAGFMSACATLTMSSCAKDLLGAAVGKSTVFQQYVYNIAVALPTSNYPTIITGILAISLMAFLQRFQFSKRLPPSLIAIAVFILASYIWFQAAGDSTTPHNGAVTNSAHIQVIGLVPSQFPRFRFPNFSNLDTAQLLITSITIAFVGFMESVGVAKMYSAKHGYEMLPSSEMKALGTVNMFGPLFQSFVVMGAFSRSAVNDNAGAKSQLSNVVSSLVVVLMLLFITPALFYLPKAVLSAIIVMAVVGLVDWRGLKRLWHVDKRDFLTMLAAFLATLFLGVLYGVIAALTFSTIIFIGMTTQPVVEELGRVGGTVIYRHVGMVGVSKVPGVKIIKFLAPLFFANCTVLRDRTFRELVERRSAPPKLKWKAIVLCFASVASIDTTSIQMLEEVLIQCRKEGVMLVIASANAIVEECFQHTGFIEKLGMAFKFNRVHEAVKAVLLGEITPENEPVIPALATTNNVTTKPASPTKRWCLPWHNTPTQSTIAAIEDKAVSKEETPKKEAIT